MNKIYETCNQSAEYIENLIRIINIITQSEGNYLFFSYNSLQFTNNSNKTEPSTFKFNNTSPNRASWRSKTIGRCKLLTYIFL
jgi:hypothetical protein